MKSIIFREATGDDLRFVEKSFLDSFRCSHAAGLISMPNWARVMSEELRILLGRPGVTVTVAAHPTEGQGESDIYGWIAVERGHRLMVTRQDKAGKHHREYERAESPLVHYVLVKEPYRRSGIARRLFEVAGVDPQRRFHYSAKTGVVSRLRSKIPGGRYDPLIARYPKT